MIENRRKLACYYAVNAFSWSTLGLYAVSLSWLILATTNSASSVGLFYFLASASSLLISPFLAPLLDKSSNTLFLVLISATVRSVALAIPLILTASNVGAANTFIFLAAILFGPSNSFFGAASEGLMLRSWPPDIRSSIAQRVGLIRQIALASGFASAGFLVAEFGSQSTSAIAAALGMASALICLRFGHEKSESVANSISDNHPYLPKLTEGISLIGSTPMLMVPCVIATIGFSVSQMSNALLAPVVTAQQKASTEFGLITSAWAVGAIAAALLINLIPVKSNKTGNRASGLVLLGVLCIILSHAESTVAQAGLFAAMGAIFSYLRIMSGVQIALHTPSEKIAKVQLTLSNLIGLTALIVYALPWLLKGLAPTSIFAVWGIAIIAMSLAILLSLRFFAKEDARAKAPPI